MTICKKLLKHLNNRKKEVVKARAQIKKGQEVEVEARIRKRRIGIEKINPTKKGKIKAKIEKIKVRREKIRAKIKKIAEIRRIRRNVKPVRSLFFDYLIDKSRVNSKRYLKQILKNKSKDNATKRNKNCKKRLKRKECKRKTRKDRD